MSADSEIPSAPEPTPSSEPSLPAGEEANAPEYLPQKRRHKRPDPAELDLSGGADDDEILILGTLLQKLLARKQAEPPEPESRSKINRFVQKNTAPLAAAPASAETPTPPSGDAAAPATSSASNSVDTPAPASRPLPKLTPRMTSPTGDDPWAAPNRGRGVLYFLFCAGLAGVAFLVGRSASHPEVGQHGNPSAAATPAPPWNATSLGRLDQVLAADQAGELQKAKNDALDLKKQIGNSLELDLYLGSLTTRLGHTNDAEADLSRLLEPSLQPLQAAAVNESIAFTYARRRDFKRAAEALADASRIDPFDPSNYYRWGEVLRRQGRLQDSIDKFRQALQRLPEGEAESESQRECAAFKLRLAQIELGRDTEVKPAIDGHLKEASPSGYWLLTAAAFALQHNDLPGATGALQKARDALPADQYAALIDDYYFHSFAQKPELAALLPPAPGSKQQKAARMVYFIDP